MTRSDWFRRTTWAPKDESDFFARLGRSRGEYHKSQYLRIQAITLFDTGLRPHVMSALGLLERLFAEYPDRSQLESAHLQAALCHESLGGLSEAIRHFQLAIEAHSIYPNFHSGVSLEFPWFIVQHGLADRFDDALLVLQSAHLAFPVQQFKAAAIRSRIAQSRGEHLLAAASAREALKSAAATGSQFRYHRSLGLVGEEYNDVVEELQRVAAT